MGTRLRAVRTQVTGRGQRPISANLSRMFFVKLPQNRHPERSASQIDCVPQRLARGVEESVLSVAEGTPALLILPMLFGAFQPPSPHRAAQTAPEPRTKKLLASCHVRRLHVPVTIKCVSQQILFSGFDGRKAPNSMGKISNAGVPSATLRTGSSTPRAKRCGTQSICEALRSG